MRHFKRHKSYGFTLVELLIVIVIIAILAAITAVAYNGITVRANDSARESDMGQLVRLAELRNVDTQNYICITCNTATTLASAYKASAIIPAKADAYMWSVVYSAPPVFNKKKLAIIQDDMNYRWMSISRWCNQKNSG